MSPEDRAELASAIVGGVMMLGFMIALMLLL